MSIEKEQMAIDHMLLVGQERVVIDLTNEEQEQADEIVIDLTNDEQAIQQVQQQEQMVIDLTIDDGNEAISIDSD
jgi:hypothetical protein